MPLRANSTSTTYRKGHVGVVNVLLLETLLFHHIDTSLEAFFYDVISCLAFHADPQRNTDLSTFNVEKKQIK